MSRVLLLLAILVPMNAAATDRVTVRYWDAKGAHPYRNAMDLYRPANAKGAPVVMFFHGGVWQVGDMRRYANVGEAFAARGFLTAVVNYRLTPDVKHPAHIEDAARATAWMFAHAAEHGGDPSKIFLTGHSAGGQLVTLLLLDPSWLQAHSVDSEGIAGVVPLSGVFDLTAPITSDGDGGFADFIQPPFGRDRAVLKAASPTHRVRATKVRVLSLVAADDDVAMRAQSAAFVAACRQAGVNVRNETVPGRGHFELVTRIGSDGDPATALIARFVAGP